MDIEASDALLKIASRADFAQDAACKVFGDLGFSDSATYCVLAFDYGYHDDETVLNAFSAICLYGEFSETIMCIYRQLVLMLAPENVYRTERFQKSLQSYLLKRSCRVGVSDSFEGFVDLVYACDEAQASLVHGFFDGDIRIVRFKECYAQYLAAHDSIDEPLVSFCLWNSVLRKILKDDNLNGSNNYIALITFLDNDCRVTKSSFILNIDKELFANQIKMIQEMYNLDLSSTNSRERIREEFRLLHNSPYMK